MQCDWTLVANNSPPCRPVLSCSGAHRACLMAMESSALSSLGYVAAAERQPWPPMHISSTGTMAAEGLLTLPIMLSLAAIPDVA